MKTPPTHFDGVCEALVKDTKRGRLFYRRCTAPASMQREQLEQRHDGAQLGLPQIGVVYRVCGAHHAARTFTPVAIAVAYRTMERERNEARAQTTDGRVRELEAKLRALSQVFRSEAAEVGAILGGASC